jgi:hypothetical protein
MQNFRRISSHTGPWEHTRDRRGTSDAHTQTYILNQAQTNYRTFYTRSPTSTEPRCVRRCATARKHRDRNHTYPTGPGVTLFAKVDHTLQILELPHAAVRQQVGTGHRKREFVRGCARTHARHQTPSLNNDLACERVMAASSGSGEQQSEGLSSPTTPHHTCTYQAHHIATRHTQHTPVQSHTTQHTHSTHLRSSTPDLDATTSRSLRALAVSWCPNNSRRTWSLRP